MHEQTKASKRRFHDGNFHYRYFRGHGIDVGAGGDGLSQSLFVFPGIQSVFDWDLQHGDAQLLASLANNSFDFLHSSHCLEHMHDPHTALHNWQRVVKPGGYLVITVPDQHMYEHDQWPSRFNSDHKWSFGTSNSSNLPKFVNVCELVHSVAGTSDLIKLELIHEFFNSGLPPTVDQTLNTVTECAWEIVLQKKW